MPAGVPLEDGAGAEHAGVEELEDRPELAQVVLDRRAAHRQAVPAAEQPGGLGGLAVGVLDRLGLVEDHVVELDLRQLGDVGAEGAVGGDDQVVLGERLAERRGGRGRCSRARLSRGVNLAASWIQLKTSERGTTARRRPLGLAAGPPPLEQGEHLDRLAQAHVVGQDAAEAELLEVVEPAQALALVGAQLAVEARRRRRPAATPSNWRSVSRTFSKAASTLDLGLRGQQRVEQAGLRRAEPEVAVLGGPQVGEHAVLLEPLLGEHAHRAVAQRRPSSRPGGRRRGGRAGSRSGRRSRPGRRARTSRCRWSRRA